jgi:hypothetical protein
MIAQLRYTRRMDQEELAAGLRTDLTPEQRSADMRLSIDPGFVHHRKIETIIGTEGMKFVDQAIARLPALPDGLRNGRINHIYKEALLTFCEALGAPTLGGILAAGRGTFFCSTQELLPATDVYHSERGVSVIVTPGVDDLTVELHYSTAHISADTTRTELAQGGPMAIVAELHSFQNKKLIFYPLLMGAPWLSAKTEPSPVPSPEWESYGFYEQFVEDIAEFAKVVDVEMPTDFTVMKDISEGAFKQCLAEILGDTARKDWGGETSDHFTSHVHLDSRRTTAAFLLKGPGNRFVPMGLNHLGKNNDQIYRLAQEPAELLVLQHCHDILPAVRATLRAFTVQPSSPRRYCLIDGRDSLRLLTAYDKLNRALELSKSSKQ